MASLANLIKLTLVLIQIPAVTIIMDQILFQSQKLQLLEILSKDGPISKLQSTCKLSETFLSTPLATKMAPTHCFIRISQKLTSSTKIFSSWGATLPPPDLAPNFKSLVTLPMERYLTGCYPSTKYTQWVLGSGQMTPKQTKTSLKTPK